MTIEEANAIINKVDINQSGEIDFFEFIIAATDQQQSLSKQKIAQAFHTFDIVSFNIVSHSQRKF